VTFHNMIAPAQTVSVSLLFFIINHSSSSQTNILAQLMDFFTSQGNLAELAKCNTDEDLFHYISTVIK
jgi:PTS system enzyme IIBC component (galactitol/fructose specific)